MGYYATSSHTLIDLQHCPVQDERLEPFLQQIKQDLQMTGWSAYQEQNHQGTLRHLGLRIGRRTGEVLLTLVVKDRHLQGIETWAEQWIDRYPRLIGVCLNHNCARTNTIFAEETVTVAGRSTLREEFAGFTLEIDSTSFFQIYTEQAERFFWWIVDQLHLSGSETIIDAFCGIGTLTLLLAQQARRVIGIEAWPDAIRQAQINARHNQILNTEFLCGTVEAILPTLSPSQIVVLDPPRKGCEAKVLATIGRHQPQQVVYISCNPATLARDLQILLADGGYELWQWRAADFFPQTVHVESVAFLRRKNAL
jgi:23S rRNA (uracil1939-C5)-methyltransferase